MLGTRFTDGAANTVRFVNLFIGGFIEFKIFDVVTGLLFASIFSWRVSVGGQLFLYFIRSGFGFFTNAAGRLFLASSCLNSEASWRNRLATSGWSTITLLFSPTSDLTSYSSALLLSLPRALPFFTWLIDDF